MKGLIAAGAFFSVTAVAILPHIAVVLTALSDESGWYRSVLPDSLTLMHFENALGHPLAMGSIRNSLVYALAAVVVDVVLGLLIAFLVVRVRVPGGRLLDGLAMLPLAVPGMVLAFGYVAMTLHWPFPQLVKLFNGWGMEGLASIFQITGEMPNPILFLVIAYAVRRLPYVVRSASAGLEQTAGELEDAAANLGASPMYSIRRVVLPLILANVIAGALLAFSFAMLEVSDSLILAQVEGDYPITKAIYALFKRLGDGPYIASAMGVWAMALMTVTLLGASVMLGKKLGAVFRI